MEQSSAFGTLDRIIFLQVVSTGVVTAMKGTALSGEFILWFHVKSELQCSGQLWEELATFKSDFTLPQEVGPTCFICCDGSCLWDLWGVCEILPEKGGLSVLRQRTKCFQDCKASRLPLIYLWNSGNSETSAEQTKLNLPAVWVDHIQQRAKDEP